MRTHYRNGDEIDLQENGCDGCSPSMVNGVLCHEHGCPDEWRDKLTECRECGAEFYAEERGQQFCSEHCAAMFYGQPCNCAFCQELRDGEAELEEQD